VTASWANTTGAPRVLVLSASVGAGHVRAAQAVELALRELAPHATVQNIDVLALTGPVFRRVYGTSYLDLVNHAPHLLGFIYDFTDKARRKGSDRLRSLAQKLPLHKVIRLLKDEPWDVVVNTHFLPADIIATLRRRKKLALRQLTVVTDFDAHAFWVNQPCEEYFVAGDEAALSLAHWGVPRESIRVTGIPIHPVFALEKTREECRARQGLTGDRPLVLLLAGGFGVGPIEKVFAELLAIEQGLEIAVICGKNARLKAALERARTPGRHRVKILGFTTEIDELMRAADVVVTKPGGLTTSEVLACGAAMVIMNPIPGQESRNSDMLLENGAAIKINAVSAVANKVAKLAAEPARLARLRANAKALGRPRAAYEIAERALAPI
jgi:processive 1,2-diacylglycerol beta-glucosyltransferase